MTLCAFIFNYKQDVNTTRYHVVSSERLLKTDLQPGGYKETLLGFSFQIGIFPRDGKVSHLSISDHLTFWSHDRLITRPSDHMTFWSHDHLITWPSESNHCLSCSSLWTTLRSTRSTSWVVTAWFRACQVFFVSTGTAVMRPNTTKSWWRQQHLKLQIHIDPHRPNRTKLTFSFLSKGNLRGLFVPTRQNLPEWHNRRCKKSNRTEKI